MTSQPPAADDPDLTGRQLNDFQLLRRLGRGGMGEVYLAQQESLGRQVAVKVLRQSLATDASYVQRFTHEARAAAKLAHANIVQIYEVGRCDGIHYIAQEYVPGQNLRQLLTRLGRPLEVSQVIAVIRQVASALQKASEQGIVHRDIKPDNILLTPDGEVKVADFGLARVTSDHEAMHLTQLGMTMGSPFYMSPEQAEGLVVDPRSDLYSFGATCYHMLAGRPPFIGESPLAVAVQHVRSEPEPLLTIRPDVPPGLSRIVHRLLAKSPQHRYASAAEVLRELRLLRSEGVSEELLEGLESWTTPELIAMSDARQGATQRLDHLLKLQAAQSPAAIQRSRFIVAMVALVIGGFLGGTLLARVFKPKPLLHVATAPANDVPRMETPSGQVIYAEMVRTERAWKAVAEFFPPEDNSTNRQFALKADKGLADLYRREERWDEAIQLYDQLTKIDPAEVQLRTEGHAGLALIYGSQSRKNEAQTELARLWERRQLLDQETRAELEQLRQKLGSES